MSIYETMWEPDPPTVIPPEVVAEAWRQYPNYHTVSRRVGGRRDCGCWTVFGQVRVPTRETALNPAFAAVFPGWCYVDQTVVLRNPKCREPHLWGSKHLQDNWAVKEDVT